VGITAGSREVPGRNACDGRHPYRIIIIIQRMWNVKTKVLPVTIEVTGTISKSFRKYVSNITGKHEVKELQKTAILCTAHTYCGKC